MTEAVQAVQSALLAVTWPGATPLVVLDNEASPSAGEFVRLIINHTEGNGQESLGPVGERRFHRRATAYAAVHVALDAGRARADALATAVRNAWEGRTLTGTVICRAGFVREPGEMGGWYVFVVEQPFDYYERK